MPKDPDAVVSRPFKASERRYPSSVYDGEQKACPWCGYPPYIDVLGRRFCSNASCEYTDELNPPDEANDAT